MLIHLPSPEDRDRYAVRGIYSPPSLEREGFIHLVRATEAVMVANLLFREADDLLAIVLNSSRLDDLRLEADRPGGFAWPHLHGPIPLETVLAVLPYPKLPNGRYGRLAPRLTQLNAGPAMQFHEPMDPATCIEIYCAIAEVASPVVVDGGWAVDAARGYQTRQHGDLDVCVPDDAVEAVASRLAGLGFAVTEDQTPTRIELRSRAGLGPQIDLHPLTFDDRGDGVQRLQDGAVFTYTAKGLSGKGRILRTEVGCLAPEFQLECHTGYEPDEDDYADVAALCAQFQLEPPTPYREAMQAEASDTGLTHPVRHIFLSPLAYLLGIEGAALLRGIREGFADRDFVEARISEVRSLLDDADLAQAGVAAKPDGFSVQDAYAAWASTYDQPNSMIEVEQPVVRRILNGLPVGVALDAACGTGRHAEYLAKLGHRVLCSDSSPEMLSVARAKLPNADLREAPL